jgi:electron transfer flavoprotein alpha subunit
VVLLSDPVYAGADTLVTARILAAAAKQIGYDLILCGRTTTEGETAQVGPMLATLLGLPLFPSVLAYENGSLTLRDEEESRPLPAEALLTVERSFPLRFPGLRSRPKEIETWSNAQLGLQPAECGLRGSPTRVLSAREAVVGARSCARIEVGDIPALLEELRRQDKQAAGEFLPSEEKLPLVLAVGQQALSAARAVGERACLLEEQDPAAIVAAIREQDPDAVLFPATAAGRNLAPIVAAMLGAGLCADCTGLSVQNGSLILTRPARGGSVIADIVCTTRPAMATVRCEVRGAEILLGLGKATLGMRARFEALAQHLGASLAATRALVDAGGAPYREQIGLTGTKAACKIYLAVGLSGAVQHTCALDGADVVIAVNPDRDARIFSCANYCAQADAEALLAAFSL